jgi:lipopolysaccharide export system permease protein
MFGMIAFAALGQPRTTRQGRGTAIAIATIIVLGLRIAGFGASALLAKHAWAAGLDYAVPLAGLVGATLYTFKSAAVSQFWRKIMDLPALPSGGWKRRA